MAVNAYQIIASETQRENQNLGTVRNKVARRGWLGLEIRNSRLSNGFSTT